LSIGFTETFSFVRFDSNHLPVIKLVTVNHTTLTKMNIAPPVMPDLEIRDVDDDAGEDKQDENHLMAILNKLKSAKRNLDSTRQK
jgi:hypothetical protein